jgi:hypothetical protein
MIRSVNANRFVECIFKNLIQEFAAKATEYGRYLSPGGYDFYWLLKDAIRAPSLKRLGLADCSKPILAIDRVAKKTQLRRSCIIR